MQPFTARWTSCLWCKPHSFPVHWQGFSVSSLASSFRLMCRLLSFGSLYSEGPWGAIQVHGEESRIRLVCPGWGREEVSCHAPASLPFDCTHWRVCTLSGADKSINSQGNLRLTNEGEEVDRGELPTNLKTHCHFRLCKHRVQFAANKPIWGFPGGSDSKESTCSAGDPGLVSGLARSPKEGNGYPL